MGVRVAVAGASGYAGGELLRLLIGHPAVELGALAAQSSAGEPVCSVHPQLPALADRRFVATDPVALAGADLVFLALPHGSSAALAAGLPPATKVVDLGADHRSVIRPAGPAGTPARTPANGRTGCPSWPAPGPRSRPQTGSPPRAAIRPPSPWAWRRCCPPASSSRPIWSWSPPAGSAAPAGWPERICWPVR